MKALFVGLGSIGCRHLKNLAALCDRRGIPLVARALRTTEKPLPDEVAALLSAQYHALPAGETYDLAFITNPTHLHAALLEALKGRVNAFFIEKPIFDHTNYNLEELGLEPRQKAYVAAPLRFTAVYAALKEALQEDIRPFSARVICSSYLPGWRPGVDYRAIYSASRAQGGGVALDLIHEWDYLVDLFGFPLASCGMRGHASHLEIDSDDIAVYISRWEGMLGEVHLDYFGREYRRGIEILCEEGRLEADFGAQSLTMPGGRTRRFAEEPNDKYMREMETFLDYALSERRESLSSPRRALELLKIVLGVDE